MTKKQKKLFRTIIIASVFFILAFFVKDILFLNISLSFMLSAVSFLICGSKSVARALKNLARLNPLDEHFLMSVAAIGAFFIGEPQEGAAVMLFYQIGELFESIAVSKSRREISLLTDIAPQYANILSGENYIQVSPDKIKENDKILIKPGERIPVDCIVDEGTSDIDTKAITGESLPQSVSCGDTRISGSINLSGVLYATAKVSYQDSTVSKILELTEKISEKKSKYESFIHRFSLFYTPIVVSLAVILAIIPSLFLGNPLLWIKRALTFLVVSCPCALVISVPLAFFAGLGRASSYGILIKGSCFLELLNRVDTAVFDKTGTLTTGGFYVTEVNPEGISKEELLMYAASSEIYSNHPVSKAVINEFCGDAIEVFDVCEEAGLGICAKSNYGTIYTGNIKLMQKYGILCESIDSLGTVLYVALNNKFLGTIVVSDKVRKNAKDAIAKLKKQGIKNIYILTGDRESVAKDTAAKVGADGVFFELLPQDKVYHMEKIMEKRKGVLFCGDGINDAPVMALSDIAVSMGQIGQAAAVEASNVVLYDDNLEKIPLAIKISKKTISIVRTNIVFSIGIKVLVMILAAFGITGIWAAVFADVGVCIIAILNSIRILKKKFVEN